MSVQQYFCQDYYSAIDLFVKTCEKAGFEVRVFSIRNLAPADTYYGVDQFVNAIMGGQYCHVDGKEIKGQLHALHYPHDETWRQAIWDRSVQ